MKRKAWAITLCVTTFACAPLRRAECQATVDSSTTLVLDVGTSTENYLRYLQSLGLVPMSQWTLRGFSPSEIRTLGNDGLLSGQKVFRSLEQPVRSRGPFHWQVIPVTGNVWYNTAFPFGQDDGAVWEGRGATLAVRSGIAFSAGPLTLQLEPIAFIAENREFPLMALPAGGASIYANPQEPGAIDRPQRFGDTHYARVDLGQSFVRLDALGLAAGVSTANEWWGPMNRYAYLLTNNAAGFPHVFAGSGQPLNIGIGRFQARVFYGQLSQSAYTQVVGPASHQFATGLIASFQPAGIKGLEIGAARMFDISWPAGGLGWRELRKPFEGFLKDRIVGDSGLTNNSSADNQLASIFARWTFPRDGLEVYGELGRNDHNANSRDLYLEPDHTMSVGLGARKAWRQSEDRLSAVSLELIDADPAALNRFRGQGTLYTHLPPGAVQGHTQRGEVLGTGFLALRGAGTRVEYERFEPESRRLSLFLERMIVRERDMAANVSPGVDVQYAAGTTFTWRRSATLVSIGFDAIYEMNRYFESDASNFRLRGELTR